MNKTNQPSAAKSDIISQVIDNPEPVWGAVAIAQGEDDEDFVSIWTADNDRPFIDHEQGGIISVKSPLRYPGGKSRAVKTISSYFPPDLTILVSPFFGGGSIEIQEASKGVRVKGYDIHDPLVCYWSYQLATPVELGRKVRELHPISKKGFVTLKASLPGMAWGVEKAAAFYALNRASFSGSTQSGGMSNGARFNDTSIERVHNFRSPNLTVEQADFSVAINGNPNEFLYLDPPYLLPADRNRLYGANGSTHRNFDHGRLFNLLKDRHSWLLSYNDCTTVRNLYAGFRIESLDWSYGMPKHSKASSEILIFSNP